MVTTLRFAAIAVAVLTTLSACGGGSTTTELTCAVGSACTPAGQADPCKTYATTCASSTAAPVCSAARNVSDGTSCGVSNVCAAGACVAACTLTSCAPVADTIRVLTRNGTPITIDVLAHASSPLGATLTVTGVTQPSKGAASVIGGQVLFDPQDARLQGTFSFQATVSDGTRSTPVAIEVQAAQALTLHGVVTDGPIAGANVVATAGVQTGSAAAGVDGGYVVTVDVVDPSVVVILAATGSPANDQGSVELRSIVGSYSALAMGQAGPLDVTASEVQALNVTQVSTAIYGAVVAANGGTVPTADATLAQAEKSVSTDQILAVAASIKVAIDSAIQYPLPPGTSTLDLATDPAVNTAYVNQVTTAAGSSAPFDLAVAATLADPVVTPPFPPTPSTTAYYFVSAAQPGFLARGGEHFTLVPDGSGAAGTGVYSGTQQAVGLTWSRSGNVLTLTFDAPFVTRSAWDITTVSDSVIARSVKDEYIRTFGTYYIYVTSYYAAESLTLVQQGTSVQWVSVQSDGTRVFDPFDVASGHYAPSARANGTNNAELRDSALTPSIPFTPVAVVGTWAAYGFYQIPGGAFFSGQPSPAQFNAEILTFLGDGSGTARITGRGFTWSIDAATGDLLVAYTDGSGSDVMRVLDILDGVRGTYTEHHDGAGALVASIYDYAYRMDPSLAVAPDLVTSGPNFYWQTYINAWYSGYWTNGQLNGDQLWGWNLLADGSGAQWTGDANGNRLYDPLTESLAVSWSQVGQTFKLFKAGPAGDLQKQYRVWTPMFFSSDTGTFYAVEEAYQRLNPSTAYGYYFEPRLAMYRLEQLKRGP
jgi:hypothetical protein